MFSPSMLLRPSARHSHQNRDLPGAALLLLLVLVTFLPVQPGYSDDTLTDNKLRVVTAEIEAADIDPRAVNVLEGERLEDFLQRLDQELLLEDVLTIHFGSDDGPLYDPADNRIQIPVPFVEEIIERLEALGGSREPDTPDALLLAAEDVLMHVLLHEVGHALIAMYEIPVLGREEDAVDAFSNLYLLESYADGGEMLLGAADMFASESNDYQELDEAHFWDEHSLDAQRYYTVVCHIYGHDPDEYEWLLDETGIPAERGEGCITEFELLTSDWRFLLEPWWPETD